MPSKPPLAQAGVEPGDHWMPMGHSDELRGKDGEEAPSAWSSEPEPDAGSLPPTPLVIGGRYRVEARIGRGGTGEIFRVVDTTSRRKVALKRLQASAASERGNVILFEREYYTLLGLKHPNIVEVYDYGHDELPYYTMELAEGHDLRELAPLPPREACLHLRDLASSLALIHTRRLVHRDVSPRNARVVSSRRCKLLDFGALCPFGAAMHLVGTPSCTAPEAYHRMPLDQRADLYGLGAVAYWLLTQRRAYDVRRFSELPSAWTQKPSAPSTFASEVPPALDALVMSLLSLDPLERPASAADVIDQLCSIAQLEPESDLRVARAYFSTARLVGRSEQMDLLRERFLSVLGGEGSAVFVEGDTGLGKTRLLTELQIQARLRGTPLVQVDAEVHRGAFGVAEALARGLLEDVPGAAEAVEDRQTLALLSPAVQARLGATTIPMSASAGERRAVLQAALENWIDGLVRVHPLVIAVDNVHRADQASAALLFTLAQRAHERFLLLVATSRSSETVSAPETIDRLQMRAIGVRLPPLQVEEVVTLLEGVFGRVPYIHRYGEWLTALTNGNPLYTLEVVQHLVESGVATYRQGVWHLREEVPQEQAANLMRQVCEHSIARLSSDGKKFAETLSVYRGSLPLELCTALTDSAERRRTYELLSELVEKDILVSHGQTYHFRHNAIRDLLSRSLNSERLKAIHRRLGQALLALEHDDAMMQIEAGWHLLRAGDESRGAELLARLAHDTHAFRAIDADIQSAVPALGAALEVFQRQHRDSLAQIPLLASLIESGYYTDYRIAERYSSQAVYHLREATGLALAERLRPRVGSVPALGAGVLKARVAFMLSKSAASSTFDELFVRLATVVCHLCGIAAMCLDAAKAVEYARVLEPLCIVGKRRAASGLFEFCMTLTMMAQDRFHDASKAWQRLIRSFGDPNFYGDLPEESRRLVLGGAWYALGVLESFRDNGAVLECAAELDKLGLKFYEIVADRLRVSYHAYRGEEAEADRYRDRLDVRASQTGSAWQVEVWDPVASITAYARTRDRMGLRRSAERLKVLAQDIPSMELHAKTAAGFYHLVRGDPRRAIASYESVLKNAKPRDHLGWAAEYGQLAAAHNAAGEHAKARARSLYALEHLPPGDRDFVVMTLELEIELAVAEATLGHTEHAARSMETLIRRYQDRGPVTLAQLYEGRARVALAAKDRETAARHLTNMERVARATGNPTLVLRWKNVVRRLRGAEPEPAVHFEAFRPSPGSLERLRLALPQAFRLRCDDDEEDVTATESRMDRELH